MKRFFLLVAALLFLVSSPVQATPGASTLERAKNKNFGEKFVFLGWSPDNLYVAYTLDRVKRPFGPKKPPRVRIRHLTRRVYKGHLGGMGPVHGKRLKTYIERQGYSIRPLTVEPVEKNLWRIDTPKAAVYLKVQAKKVLTWVLYSSEGELAQGTMNKPYIRFEPQAFLSPNGKMLLMAMQVNTGWYEDAIVQTARIEALR